MYREDTIAAIATPGSGSGIGVIRISGENAIEVADKIFQPKNRNKRLPEQPTSERLYSGKRAHGKTIGF